MISIKEAYDLIDSSVSPLDAKTVPIAKSVNCKLIEDLLSPLNVPEFTNSAMDGIAIRFSDLADTAPWRLKIQETIQAGDPPSKTLQKGYAVKIMTGAPLPQDADTVIRVEELTFHDDTVELKHKPIPGTHVRPVGDDLEEGELVFKQGHILKPIDIGVLASMGLEQMRVIPKPEIAIISTGSEIVAKGSRLQPGQIYNSNDTTLSLLLENAGFYSVTVFPPVIDDVELQRKCFSESLSSNHLVITTGGVSMGDFDYIPHVVEKMGGEIIFHKVKIKPGKPVLLAKFNINGERWLIGLPGNPVSVVVGYHLFVKYLISRLMGISYRQKKVRASLTADTQTSGDNEKVIGVSLVEGIEGMSAVPSSRQKSGRLSSMRSVDGFILVKGGNQVLPAGSEVEVELL